MDSATIEAGYCNLMRIPVKGIVNSAVSYDHHGLHGSPRIDLRTRRRGYPTECLRPPEEHLRILEARKRIGRGLVLTQTCRNAFQNIRSPLYSKTDGICQSSDEKVAASLRPYYGIAHMDDMSFQGMAMDFSAPVPSAVRYWVPGVPVLWRGRVTPLEEMVTEVGDFCHLYKLDVSKRRGENPEHVERYDQLTKIFETHLHSPADEASAALIGAAADLEREDYYLHNAVACSPSHLMIIVAHGRLEQIGQLALAHGAQDCVVVDNGGSVQVAIRYPGDRLRPLIGSYYFREPTIAIAAYEFQIEPAVAAFKGNSMLGLSIESFNRNTVRDSR